MPAKKSYGVDHEPYEEDPLVMVDRFSSERFTGKEASDTIEVPEKSGRQATDLLSPTFTADTVSSFASRHSCEFAAQRCSIHPDVQFFVWHFSIGYNNYTSFPLAVSVEIENLYNKWADLPEEEQRERHVYPLETKPGSTVDFRNMEEQFSFGQMSNKVRPIKRVPA